MLARISALRTIPRVVVVPVRYQSGPTEGSVAKSREFGKKEKAHEDEYVHRHEMELLKKMREQIIAKKKELDALEKAEAELEKNHKA
ncbi:hypothetical protein H0H92_005234 [Tricholoma furcatifolium]|nr:hypothetical protein H0H92_005234 [Tricholoma furcatifolium]